MCSPSIAQAAPLQAAPLACLLLDDNPSVAAALADCVRRVPALAVAGTCTSAEQALAQLETQPIDVLFLDIELPLLAGLELLHLLSTRPGPAVVLTTAYPDCNMQGYGVVDCLRKPLDFTRFLSVAQRLVAWREAGRPPRSQPPAVASQADGLYFWVDQRLMQVRLADVLYIERLPLGCRVCTTQGEFITTQTFCALAGQLPEPRFLRVHPAFAVALPHTTHAAPTGLTVGDRHIPIGPALQDEVLARAFHTTVWGA